MSAGYFVKGFGKGSRLYMEHELSVNNAKLYAKQIDMQEERIKQSALQFEQQQPFRKQQLENLQTEGLIKKEKLRQLKAGETGEDIDKNRIVLQHGQAVFDKGANQALVNLALTKGGRVETVSVADPANPLAKIQKTYITTPDGKRYGDDQMDQILSAYGISQIEDENDPVIQGIIEEKEKGSTGWVGKTLNTIENLIKDGLQERLELKKWALDKITVSNQERLESAGINQEMIRQVLESYNIN